MKFFITVNLLSVFLLIMSAEMRAKSVSLPNKKIPTFLKDYKEKIKNSFKKPENANVLFSFITGDKSGISPHTKKAFKKVNLSYLLSPSGIHLSGFFFFFAFIIKKSKIKKLKRILTLFFFLTHLFFPLSDSIKRLSLFKIFKQSKRLNCSYLFFLIFIVSFLIGDFSKSPLGFIYSFIFLGTFLSLREHPKGILILGIFSTQLILGIFLGEKVSLLAIPIGLFFSFLFTFIFPILILFLMSFWIVPINWGEGIIQSFIFIIKVFSKLLNGSFTSSSIFLIAAIWILLSVNFSYKKIFCFSILLFLHTNTAMTPCHF